MTWSKQYQKMKTVKEVHYPVSATNKDIFTEYWFIDLLELDEIIEFGAGTGNWSICIDHLTYNPNKQRTFHQVENFNYKGHVFMGWVYEKENWPTTPEELIKHCTTASIDVTKREIKTKYYFEDANDIFKKDAETKFNAVRIDCDIDWNLFWKWLYSNTNNNYIIIVDDIAPNYCYERFYNMMKETTKTGNIKPIWFGINSGIWCNSDLDVTDIHEYAIENFTHLYNKIRTRDGILITR